MPSAAEKAKAKLEAVLNNPGRNDASNYPTRVMSTRHPSVGGCEVTNSVARRPSASSQGSDGGGVKNMVKRMLNLPAY